MTMSPVIGTAIPPRPNLTVQLPYNPLVTDGNGLMYFCGPGGCDPLQRNNPFGLLCHRYSVVWLAFVAEARPDAENQFDLVLAEGDGPSPFSAGPTQSGVSMGIPEAAGPVDECDVTTFENGDIADVDSVFVASGMAIQAERPFRLYAEDIDAEDPDAEGPCLGYDPDLDDLAPRMIHAVLTEVCLRTLFGRNACNYNLGLLKYWPQYSGPAHDGRIPVNGTPIARLYMPFCFPLCISSSDTANKLTMRLHVGHCIRIRSSSVCPITSNQTVYLPVRIDLIGSTICFPRFYQAAPGVLVPGIIAPPPPVVVSP